MPNCTAGSKYSMTFIKREKIERINSPILNLIINISIISVGCYIVGLFTNGVAARISAFFDIFTLLLLPWLVKKVYDESMGKTITIASFIGYMAFFLYNMYGVHNGVYISDNLGLTFWV